MGGRRVADAMVRRDACQSAPRRRSVRSNQGGFILAYVLGAVLFLSIIGLAILSMTVTATNVSVGMLDTAARSHAIDAGLEETVQRIRHFDDPDEGAATLDYCNGIGVVYTAPDTGAELEAQCTSSVAFFDDQNREVGRLVHLGVSEAGGSRLLGNAVVRIVDYVYDDRVAPGRPQSLVRPVGYDVQVCSWRIGVQNVVANAGCPL